MKKVATRQQPGRTASSEKRRAARHKEWMLRLCIAGRTPRSVAAISNLKRICEEHLKGRYRIEVVDLLVSPQLSRDDQIVAIPTLVRERPVLMRKIVGDLSDTARTFVGLQLRPAA